MCNKVENRWPISVAGFPSVGLTFTRGHFRAASLNHGSDHRELLFTFSRVSGWNAKCKMLFRPTIAARYKNEAKRLRNRWFPTRFPSSASICICICICLSLSFSGDPHSHSHSQHFAYYLFRLFDFLINFCLLCGGWVSQYPKILKMYETAS